jgi:hypothetical protein
MGLTTEQTDEFKALAKPLMDWLERNCHPHTTVILDSHRAELVEGQFCFGKPIDADYANSLAQHELMTPGVRVWDSPPNPLPSVLGKPATE